MNLDLTVFQAINSLAGQSPILDAIAVFSARWLIVLMAVFLLALWFRKRPGGDAQRERLAILNAFWVGLVAYGAKWLISLFVFRPRPFVDHVVTQLISMSLDDPSFPSGHATFAFGLAFSVLLFDRRIGFPLLAAALLVGVGRVFVGVHYPSDILAGAIVGTLLALIIRVVSFRLDRRIISLLFRSVNRRH